MDFKFNFAASGAESGTDAGFKFNFGSNDDEVSSAVESLSALRITPQGHFVAKEVKIEGKEEELDEMAIEALFEEMHFRNREPLKRCRPPNSESLEGPIAEVIDKSDLASGVYEGGFKVWEGSLDLIEYLVQEKLPVKGKRVIELGCGHGLPGIQMLCDGADVDFQDYNEEVLKEVCCLNVLVNCPNTPSAVRYFSGDWGSLAACTGKVYDVILTAETIYDDKSSGRLIACIDDILKPDGVAYIAAKSYYFGVGGSTRQFEAQVAKLLPRRKLEQVALIQDGSSNVREILRLSPEVA
mmetsp:Transcript_30522/g.98348  ORF Transcript_30522/g.98348 Transcript_30522/m.98348 type:complete len:297 (-) Transcript_30522:93-983(-)